MEAVRPRQSQAQAIDGWRALRQRIREPAIRAARARDEQRRWAQQQRYNAELRAMRAPRIYR
jgi:hypothetical protein